jgi:hypothetical protein
VRVRFHGAAGEVTGSLHEVEAARRNTDPFPGDVTVAFVEHEILL